MPGGLTRCDKCGEYSIFETLSCWNNCDTDNYSYSSTSYTPVERRCSSCSRVISEWEYSQYNGYCSSHKNECRFPGCNLRTESYDGYCSNGNHNWREEIEYYKTQLNNATRERDNRPTNQQYNNLLQEQRNLQARRDELQGQLNTANGQVHGFQTRLTELNRLLELKRQEIRWLQTQFRTHMGNREYECKIEFNYPPQYKNN